MNGPELLVIGVDHGTAKAGLCIFDRQGLRWTWQVALAPTGSGPDQLAGRLHDLCLKVELAKHAAEKLTERASPQHYELVVAVERPIVYGSGGGKESAEAAWSAVAGGFLTGGEKAKRRTQGRGSGIVGAGFGAVLATCGRLHLRVVLVYPATAKSHLAGSGRASKGEMVAAATRHVAHGRVPGEDEADALGLAMAGYAAVMTERARLAAGAPLTARLTRTTTTKGTPR